MVSVAGAEPISDRDALAHHISIGLIDLGKAFDPSDHDALKTWSNAIADLLAEPQWKLSTERQKEVADAIIKHLSLKHEVISELQHPVVKQIALESLLDQIRSYLTYGAGDTKSVEAVRKQLATVREGYVKELHAAYPGRIDAINGAVALIEDHEVRVTGDPLRQYGAPPTADALAGAARTWKTEKTELHRQLADSNLTTRQATNFIFRSLTASLPSAAMPPQVEPSKKLLDLRKWVDEHDEEVGVYGATKAVESMEREQQRIQQQR